MLRWRLLLGTLIVAVLAALCWLDLRLDRASAASGAWLLPAAIAFTFFTTADVLYLGRAGGARPLAWAVHAGNLLIVIGQWLPLGHSLGRQTPGQPLLWPLAAAVLAVFAGEMLRYKKPGGALVGIAVGVFALVYVGVMLAFAVQLWIGWGIGAIAAWIIVVKMGDTGAYTVGRLIGRHKLAPLISPGKTIEGAIGALVFSCAASWAAFAWLVPVATHEEVPPGGPWGWLVFGLLMGLVGMAGDLAESLLKRDVGCKDSSQWLPGFGGVLDILDSLLLTAPVAWACWFFGFVGR